LPIRIGWHGFTRLAEKSIAATLEDICFHIVDYQEFTEEISHLYDADDEKGAVLLADEFPELYRRYAIENDLIEEGEEEEE
jgi:hypothetical protein